MNISLLYEISSIVIFFVILLNIGSTFFDSKKMSDNEIQVNQPKVDGPSSEGSKPLLKDKNENWKVYIKTNSKFSYQVEYPSNWTWKESGNVTYFLPSRPISNKESIFIVIINYKETPPLPIWYTYTTIRTVKVGNKKILVQEREPSSVTELYIAEIKKANYTAEFRFSLNRKYDEVFDHMLCTFKFNEF